MGRLALGLDSSTQSLTAIVVDIDTRIVVYEHSLDYRGDSRMAGFGVNTDYILPSKEQGEANQPAAMYLASLDAVFGDITKQFPAFNLSVSDIEAINVSGQQHGHVLLKNGSQQIFGRLRDSEVSPSEGLVAMLEQALAVPFARIWKTAFTAELADRVRQGVGGAEEIIKLTGSNAPWRFSAFGIMRTGQDYPQQYQNTQVIHQISSLIPAVLVGSLEVPLDYGNACGTSLMNYTQRQWAGELIRAVGKDLPGGAEALEQKLPRLASGKSLAGQIANYFVSKYGFSSKCVVGIGSGDNPQTKVTRKELRQLWS